MYVRVKLTAPRTQDPNMFCGVILKADLEDLEVRFMKEIKASGSNTCYFVWPDIVHESWISKGDVVETLACSIMDRRGHYHISS